MIETKHCLVALIVSEERHTTNKMSESGMSYVLMRVNVERKLRRDLRKK